MTQHETEGLEKIFNSFFANKDCKNLYPLVGKYSRIDYLMVSADTQIVLEYKNRFNTVYDYHSIIVQRDKFENLVHACKLLNARGLYIMEYLDCILIFELKNPDNYKWEQRDMPFEHKGNMIKKYVAYLPYEDAAYIIGKKDGILKEATKEQFYQYLKIKREERK